MVSWRLGECVLLADCTLVNPSFYSQSLSREAGSEACGLGAEVHLSPLLTQEERRAAVAKAVAKKELEALRGRNEFCLE